MKQQTFKYLVTTLLTTVAFSYSGPEFKLNKKSVPKDLVPNIERFLSNVDEKVPATVRDAIGEAVEITFMIRRNFLGVFLQVCNMILI